MVAKPRGLAVSLISFKKKFQTYFPLEPMVIVKTTIWQIFSPGEAQQNSQNEQGHSKYMLGRDFL